MASANHDANHLRLSRKIFDPVAAAATNGAEVTSLLRNDYLNRASKFIQLFLYSMDKTPDKKIVQEYLSGLVLNVSVTFTTGIGAIPSGLSFILGLSKSSTNARFLYVQPAEIRDAIANAAYLRPRVFTSYGTSLAAYESGVAIEGALLLTYLIDDQRASSGDSADIAINSTWFDALVDIAATYHWEDKGKFDFSEMQKRRLDTIMTVIGQDGNRKEDTGTIRAR